MNKIIVGRKQLKDNNTYNMLGYTSSYCKIITYLTAKLRLAQLVEHSTVDRTVNGSIPLAEIIF